MAVVRIGDKVINPTGFGFMVKIVTSRTANTIATKHQNGSSDDHRASLADFRLCTGEAAEAIVARILQIERNIADERKEQSELYNSLEKLE